MKGTNSNRQTCPFNPGINETILLPEAIVDQLAALHRVADYIVHVTEETHKPLDQLLKFGDPADRFFDDLCHLAL